MPVPSAQPENKFLTRVNVIDNNIRFAEAVDKVKSRLMIKVNPNYPSTMNTSFGLRKGKGADEPTSSLHFADSTEADDLSMMTDSNLSQLTLE